MDLDNVSFLHVEVSRFDDFVGFNYHADEFKHIDTLLWHLVEDEGVFLCVVVEFLEEACVRLQIPDDWVDSCWLDRRDEYADVLVVNGEICS